jgi:hypothetical protein
MNESSSNAVDVKVKQPCILVFDSLVGETRSRVYSTLREYLKMEYKVNNLINKIPSIQKLVNKL